LALAEPDYDSRVDRPAALVPLGRWQTESLRRQGADPGLGSSLAGLFRRSGLQLIETGTLGGNDEHMLSSSEWEMEWEVLEADLQGLVPAQELFRMKALDQKAWEQGERLLHVPTYFAWGLVNAQMV
jgi:hypothetical protein